VIGGSGDYFDVADRVVMMENFAPADVTAEAHAIARRFATPEADALATAAAAAPFGSVAQRIVASVCDTPVEKVGLPLNAHRSWDGLSLAKVGGRD
jgi:predicted ABC-class ATPase